MKEDELSQVVGWTAIEHLSGSGEATKQDRQMFLRVADAALSLVTDGADSDNDPRDDSESDRSHTEQPASEGDARGDVQ